MLPPSGRHRPWGGVVESRTLLSIGLAALAFSLLNVGLALEKKGASQLPNIEGAGAARSLRNFLTNPTWLIGFLLTNIQIVFLSLALGLGPMSLVTPMAGVGLVVLAAFSHFYLGESISRPMLVGILLVVAGIAILGATHPGDPEPLAADAALVLALKPGALGFFLAMAVLGAAPIIASKRAGWRAADVAFGVASGACASLATIALRLMMAGTGTEGEAGSFAALVTRVATYPLLALVIGGNMASMVMQQFGFQKGKAVVVAPVYTVATVVLPALAGVIVFGEWVRFGGDQVAVQAGAMVLVLAGTAVLSAFGASRSSVPAV